MEIIYSRKKDKKVKPYEFIPFDPSPHIREIIPLTPPNTKEWIPFEPPNLKLSDKNQN